MAVKAVVFDVGETLVNETRPWTVYAERAGVSPLVFFAALGALIERRDDHRNVFELLGIEASPDSVPYELGDLYDDALPCLETLRRQYLVGVVGNQPRETEAFLHQAGLAADFVASSAGWGVSKPRAGFFERVVEAAGVPAGEIAHVGDRVDNDVVPAKRAGMVAVHVRRGPWGSLQSEWPEAALAEIRVDSLADLPDALAGV